MYNHQLDTFLCVADARTRARNAMQKGDKVIRIGTSIMTPISC